jgi:UDP-galactopyranose mutase
VRLNREDRYFLDPFQGIPAEGYEALFLRMLSHPKIDVQLSEEFATVPKGVRYDHLVFTGTLDGFYGYRYGKLPYRSVKLRFVNHPTPDGRLIQAAPQINYPSESIPHTRSVEFRQLTGQPHTSSTIGFEYPADAGELCYPFPSLDSRATYGRYRRLAAPERSVTFIGRLAQYKYLDMDQVVAQALRAASLIPGRS